MTLRGDGTRLWGPTSYMRVSSFVLALSACASDPKPDTTTPTPPPTTQPTCTPTDEVIGDGIDQNCDRIDPCFEDADNDNAPDSADLATATADLDAGENCTDLPGAAPQGVLDCDPADGSIYPGAAELPGDDVDQNCDDVEDCWEDDDDDNYARSNPATVVDAADYGAGETCADAPFAAPTTVDVDCNDTSASYNPEASEDVLDPDYDCDQMVLCYQDADGDGYGDDQGATALANVPSPGAASTCATEGGVSATADDCEDSIYAVNPGVPEVIDLIDNDCDGEYRCYVDGDGDLSPGTSQDGLTAVCGGATSVTQDDCDDTDGNRFPGNTAGFCDGADSDCDGGDEWVHNLSQDAVYPGASPTAQLTSALADAAQGDIIELCDDVTFMGPFTIDDNIALAGSDGVGPSTTTFDIAPYETQSVLTVNAPIVGGQLVTIDDIDISGDVNTVPAEGGCLNIQGGDVVLTNVNMEDCHADDGGALYQGTGSFLDWTEGACTASYSTNRGGCLWSNGNTTIATVDFTSNAATTYGGALNLEASGSLLWLSGTCSLNSAVVGGGCIHTLDGSSATFGNDDTADGAEVEFSGGPSGNTAGAKGSQAVFGGSATALSDTKLRHPGTLVAPEDCEPTAIESL